MQQPVRGGEGFAGPASLNGRANDASVSLYRLHNPRMDQPCDICGHDGEAELLITCTKCKISSEHTYCMRMIPGVIPVDWVCEACLGGDKVTGKTVVPAVHQGAKFSCKKTVQAGKVKFISSEEVMKLTAGAPDKSKITVARRTPVKTKALASLCSPSRKINPTVDQANVSNAQDKTTCLQPSRALMSCEGRANVKHKHSDYENRNLLDVLPNIHEYRAFLPALQVVWTGRFVFGDTVTSGECYGEFQAQPPCRVHRKAYEASKRLPPVLQVELLSELPFEVNLFMDPLQLHDIALYFSPSDPIERLRQKKSSVIDQLEIHRSIMRSYINGVELLIFASKHLHHDSQKIIRKLLGDCLLLGVFRPTKNDTVESRERKAIISHAGGSQISDTKSKMEAVDKKTTKINKLEVESHKCKAVVSHAGSSQIPDTKAKIETVNKKTLKVNKDEVESQERKAVVPPAGQSQTCNRKSKFDASDTKFDQKQTGKNSLISRLDAAITELKLKPKHQELQERDKSSLVAKKIKEETEKDLPLKSSSKSSLYALDKLPYPPGSEKKRG